MKSTSFDRVETLSCGSRIQHGSFNKRIYLIRAASEGLATLPDRLIGLARENGYGKIFAKLPESQTPPFFKAGFVLEAEIPAFYQGSEKGMFLGYFLSEERKNESAHQTYRMNKALALQKRHSRIKPLNTTRFTVRTCREDDLEAMAGIYRSVFSSYPFPIHDPAYLLKTMRSDVDYFGIESAGKLIALASAEKSREALHAEMTDFATLPGHRGYGLAAHLLLHMEKEMGVQGYLTLFTIARAASPGMNITFARAGYLHGGKLKNNTHIAGQIESMYIWYKHLFTGK